ncbi:MAG: hypothetical protein ACIAS6_11370 [Phycisphaerales bacterium JB060]
MRLVGAIMLLASALCLFGAGVQPGRAQHGAFRYAHGIESNLRERVEMERQAVAAAGRAGEAERWAVTVLLMLEMARGVDDPVAKAYTLDAALAELTRAGSRDLIAGVPEGRRRSLLESLESFDADDPIGMRRCARELAQGRLDVLADEVLGAEDPNAALDGLLASHGWLAAGQVGPAGRQRARDRADYRAATRHEVYRFDGMARWHMLLPPTEGLAGVPVEELDRKWQRARNLMVHLDRRWVHQDGPRIHDFLLDLMLRDNTGIVRLVHADTQRLAHADRERRWRLREAIWRLEPS